MLQCSFLFVVKEIIIFMTSCKLVIGNYKGLYNANIWMSTALWGISGNVCNNSCVQEEHRSGRIFESPCHRAATTN